MNCIHLNLEGNTTKYYFCKVKNKSINEFECRNCLLKIDGKQGESNEIFDYLKNELF